MSTPAKPSSKVRQVSNFSPAVREPQKSSSQNHQTPRRSFFHRLNARFPWLKIVAFAALIAIIVVDFTSILIPRTSDSPVAITTAPMRKHVRVTERSLKGRQLVALTFDDGPNLSTTPALLDVLKAKEVPATFFMLGTKLRANPDIALRAEAEGHEIASHTMYHQNLTKISVSAALSDIREAAETFNSVLGHGPSALRTPYGNHNSTIDNNAGVPIILWSVDTLDWKYRTTESIVEIALSQVKDGAIILMHDIYSTSVEAVPVLIDTLRGEGYEFVTVSELAQLYGQTLAPGQVYYHISH